MTVPNGYKETDRKAYGSQQEAAEAWADVLWPDHNVLDANETYGVPSLARAAARNVGADRMAELYSSDNFRGYQFPDGSGVLMHYRTREAIRTADGTVITNHQCWSQGFAHCSPPRNADARLPLEAIESVLDDGDTVFDIVDVINAESTRTYGGREFTSVRATDTVAVVDGAEKRYGIYVGRDPSSIGGVRHYVMVLEGHELIDIEDGRINVEDVPEKALTPSVVRELVDGGMRVVHSTDYARTYLDDDEAAAHREAGGTLTKSRSKWRDTMINRAQYRADLQGRVIVRQGEWFFIPTSREDVPEEGTRYAFKALGNHRAMRFQGARSPLPRTCGVCDSTGDPVELSTDGGVVEATVRADASLHVDEDGEVWCNVCGSHVPRDIYVRGQVSHANGDHNSINLGETWHRAVTHGRDVLMYDDNPAPSSSFGGGWD